MNRVEFEEAVDVLRAIVAAIRATVSAPTLRQACGALSAAAPGAVTSATIGAPLQGCVSQAVMDGATFDALDRARVAALSITTMGAPAAAIKRAAAQMLLAACCRTLANTLIVSRREADGWLARMNDAFDAAEDLAAEDADVSQHRALVALHAAVANDLVTRGRPLPAMVTYRFPIQLPSLALANKLYGDADRADEIERENGPSHPLFMPRTGLALSR